MICSKIQACSLSLGLLVRLDERAFQTEVATRTTTCRVRPHPIIPGLEYRRIHSLFFAFQLEDTAAAEAVAITRSANLAGPMTHVVRLENLHITFHLAAQQEGIPKSLIERAAGAVGSVAASSFDVCFDHLGNFDLGRPEHALVLLCGSGLSALTSLHSQIGEAMKHAGFKHVGKSFVPHVTLAYDTKPFATPQIEPVSWSVNRFALIESPRGKGQHRIQGSWMLT